MLLLLLLLFFGTLLHESLGKTSSGMVAIVSKEKQKEIIDRINAVRRAVQPTASNMLKMEWSEKASESAKKWAEKCKPVSSSKAQRTVDGTFCGESRMQTNYVAPWSEVIDTWHAKISNFKYGLGAIDPKKEIYSYTQLIWYKTNEIGCAMAHCPQNEFPYFYACRFCPAGNIVESIATPYKEGPPCGDCPHECEDKLCINPCRFKDKRDDCLSMLNLFTCEQAMMRSQCQATCECTKHIV